MNAEEHLKMISTEIERIEHCVPADYMEISDGFQQIMLGMISGHCGEDLFFPNSVTLEILHNLAELSAYDIDLRVAGFFVKNITADIPIKKRYKFINTLLRKAVRENGQKFYARAQVEVPPEWRRDSLLLPLD